MSRARDRKRRPARGSQTRDPRRRLLVVCEGEVTEPLYLKGFERWCRNPLVLVEYPEGHGVPMTLVNKAKELKDDALKAAKRSDPNLAYDSVWCVFDVDEHPHLNAALDKARQNGIEVALSNPCFELWVLLHLRESPGPQDGDTVQKMVQKHLPGAGKHIPFEALKGGYEQACLRAQRLDEAARQDGNPRRNPTTGVHRLTEEIRGHKR